MTTAKPPARYGAIGGARPGGFALPSYTTERDTIHDNIEVIYKKLTERRDTADVSKALSSRLASRHAACYKSINEG
ncbi:hypothetical protein [Bradyrhizobium japonicum]|uniref:hypothetical protein n=1 Tax=Bradyrhizobium japonicum TaxID=375 RepID=UPI001B8A85A3|nr:hypothetical protein [Bradyrhizobium japonicum]MBR0974327.1 hypothetical protein [Bradyrhizobium japonicum]